MKSLVKVAIVVLILAMALMLPAGVSAQVEDWSVPLAITSGIGSVDVAFGVNSLATDGFDDDYDIPAPMPPMEGVEAYFYYPDNPQYRRKLATSIVAPADSIIWPLKVKYITEGGAGEVTIPWQSTDIDNVPSKYLTLELQDETGNKLADMRTETSYTFTATPNLLYSFQIKAEVPVVIAISVEPTSVDFGSVTAGVASDPQTVTVTNTGNVAEDFSATIENESPVGVYTGSPGLTIGGASVSAWGVTNVPVSEAKSEALVLTVPTGTAPGTYTATLVFWAEATGP